LQPADECEYRDILTTVENFDQLALRVADIGFEVVNLSHFDSENVVVVLLDLPARGILGDERFGYLFEVVKRMWRQGVEPI